MSTLSAQLSQRPLPLTPPSQTEPSSQAPKMSIQLPQTPQSPSQHTGKASPIDLSNTHNNTLPTPAHSINGSVPQSSNMASPDSNKRKRDLEDDQNGDRKQKKMHLEDRELSIDDLHIDVGKKYLLCSTQHPKVGPDYSMDLIGLYGLGDIAAKVARTLPNGEKNGLRKTYKGKIKDLNITGKFDVSVHEEEDGGLFAMMCVPENEWHLQHIGPSPISKGLDNSVLEMLPRSMTMMKGIIPKTEWDSSVLGDLDPKVVEKKTEKKSATSTPRPSSSLAVHKNTPTGSIQRSVSASDIARPKRKIKQRSYGDQSFEGYGEGFVDDEMVEGGYSTGEGEGGSQKRRKKNREGPTSGPSQRNSYGPGMVGA